MSTQIRIPRSQRQREQIVFELVSSKMKIKAKNELKNTNQNDIKISISI